MNSVPPAPPTADGSVTPRWNAEADYDQRFQSRNHSAYFGDSGFSNYGYWDQTTRDPVHACETLVEKMIATFAVPNGTVLDVACGCGGTTGLLARRFPAENITAINISRYQLDRTQAKVPGCTCRQMDAAQLDFPDASFDHVLCIEAACCFRSRLRFFKEAYRVLKPGGRLALTDILVDIPSSALRVQEAPPDLEEIPLVNRVTAVVYRDMLEAVGFRDIQMTSALDQTVRAFQAYSLGWVSHHVNHLEKVTAQDLLMYGAFLNSAAGANAEVKDYILVSVGK